MNISGLPADLEEFIQRELSEGKYRSEAELLSDALRLLREHQSRPEGRREHGALHAPIWEVFQETLHDIPEEELIQLPSDAAEQHDHYTFPLEFQRATRRDDERPLTEKSQSTGTKGLR